MPALSLDHTGWPMATSVTVSMSWPEAMSRMRSWNRSEPLSSTSTAASFAVGAHLERAEAEIILALGLGRLVEQRLVGPAGEFPPVPVAVLRAGLERPPVEPLAVADRDRAFVFLEPALHLLEQRLDSSPCGFIAASKYAFSAFR